MRDYLLDDYDDFAGDAFGPEMIGDNGPPPPPFKSVRFPGFAWNAIFLKSSWYGEIKSDVYMIFRGIQRCLDDI